MGESAKIEMEMNRLGWNFGQKKKSREQFCGFVLYICVCVWLEFGT